MVAAWQSNGEGGSFAGGRVDGDGPAVELDEGLDQAEAEAHPLLAELVVARRVVHRVVAGEERLEQVGPVGRGDPDPGVGHLDPDRRRPRCAGGDPDRPAIGGELDRVDDQVGHHVGDLRRVDFRRPEVGGDRNSTVCRLASRNGCNPATAWRIKGSSGTAAVARSGDICPVLRSLSIRSTVLASRSPAPWIRSTQVRSEAVAAALIDIFHSSVRPRTTVTGVLSSWLATSMNFPLSRTASVRRALVSFNSREEPVLLGDQGVLLDRLADHGGQLVDVPGFGDVAGDVAPVDGVDHRLDVGIAGEEEPGGVGADGAGSLQELDARHLGHPLVGHDDIDLDVARQRGQGLGRVLVRQDAEFEAETGRGATGGLRARRPRPGGSAA